MALEDFGSGNMYGTMFHTIGWLGRKKMQKKITLSLDAELVERVRQLVKAGDAKSQSEFFEEALRAKLQRFEWEKWCQEMEEASKDPMFLADSEDIDRAFVQADAETARMIE